MPRKFTRATHTGMQKLRQHRELLHRSAPHGALMQKGEASTCQSLTQKQSPIDKPLANGKFSFHQQSHWGTKLLLSVQASCPKVDGQQRVNSVASLEVPSLTLLQQDFSFLKIPSYYFSFYCVHVFPLSFYSTSPLLVSLSLVILWDFLSEQVGLKFECPLLDCCISLHF